MSIHFTLPFWGLIGIVLIIGFVACWIISLFEDNRGYGGDIFNAILIILVIFMTIAICIGMIIGRYLF